MRYKTYLKRCVLNAYLPWNGEANSKTMIKEIIHSISHACELLQKYVNGNVGTDKGKERDEQQICGMQYRWQLEGKKQPEICA